MANGQINKLLEAANLQMAAEAFLAQQDDAVQDRPVPEAILERLKAGNQHASKFMPSQAAEIGRAHV